MPVIRDNCKHERDRCARLLLEKWETRPRLVELPVPEPGPGEVLLRIGGAGCCHSDVSMYQDFTDGMMPWGPPYVLGHENAGWAEAAGPGVVGVDIGAAYAVYGPLGCNQCVQCARGASNYCSNMSTLDSWGLGVGTHGGMADFMIAPAANLVAIGDLDPASAAPLTDAALTPFHAIKRSLPKLGPGSTAVAIGLGGLGQLAVQILAAVTSSTIIGIDSKDTARAAALANGASLVLEPGEEAGAAIREATRGRGANAVFDFVGRRTTVEAAIASAGVDSDVTVVGIANETIDWSFFSVPPALNLSTTSWGTRPELFEVIALAQSGHIVAEIERFSLDDVETAYARLEAGALDKRAVIVP